MNDFYSLIKSRQSCRNFDSRSILERDISACIESARLAPSACNSQPWKFIGVCDPSKTIQVSKAVQVASLNKFTSNCPAFIVVVENQQSITASVGGKIQNQKYAGIDIGIATAHITLCATEMGLSTCILGIFNERKLKTLLNIPKSKRIRLVIALGFAKEGDILREKVRKPLDEILSFNKF